MGNCNSTTRLRSFFDVRARLEEIEKRARFSRRPEKPREKLELFVHPKIVSDSKVIATRSTVFIRQRESHTLLGQGMVITTNDGNHYLFTAAELATKLVGFTGDLDLQWKGGYTLGAKIISINITKAHLMTGSDMALIEVDVPIKEETRLCSFRVPILSHDPGPTSRESVTVFCRSKDRHTFELSPAERKDVYPGCPVFDWKGELYGLVCGEHNPSIRGLPHPDWRHASKEQVSGAGEIFWRLKEEKKDIVSKMEQANEAFRSLERMHFHDVSEEQQVYMKGLAFLLGYRMSETCTLYELMHVAAEYCLDSNDNVSFPLSTVAVRSPIHLTTSWPQRPTSSGRYPSTKRLAKTKSAASTKVDNNEYQTDGDASEDYH